MCILFLLRSFVSFLLLFVFFLGFVYLNAIEGILRIEVERHMNNDDELIHKRTKMTLNTDGDGAGNCYIFRLMKYMVSFLKFIH